MNDVYVCISGDIDGDLEDKSRITEYLAVLRKYGVKATFPTTLEAVESYPKDTDNAKGHDLRNMGSKCIKTGVLETL